ncbi:MAG: hypothetical protein JXB45_06910 [Candidatus Krumholzibacteriota bacterium]|nr:hypothetical protein [Candidatus Krumholzibacteriota bacterium]
MIRILSYILALLLLQSCASAPPVRVPVEREDHLRGIFPPIDKGSDLVLAGKVRLDLPRYRVRGVCQILYSPGNGAQIDFTHSSLFGAYRENATIYLSEEEMVIFDHERETVWDSDSTLSLLERYFDFKVFPDDLLYILLLAVPACEMLEMDRKDASQEQYVLYGRWRGRKMELEVSGERGPLRFDLCAGNSSGCYSARYGYNRGEGRYPSKIVLESGSGDHRLSFSDIRTWKEGGKN